MDKRESNIMERQVTSLELLVDSTAFWDRLQADIAGASRRVYVQTLSFEGDRIGCMLADSMTASPAADKRIIVDYYTKYVLSDKFRYSPRNWLDRELKEEHRATTRMVAGLNADGTQVKFVNPVGPLFVRMPARNHKKIIVVDDTIGYIGGINFSDHNFLWHDMMLRIESPGVAEFLAEDFLSSWQGRRYSGQLSLEDIELYSFDGRSNRDGFEPILNLIRSAESSIYVQSPYLSSPFTGAMRHAADRGASITVVSPDKNNKKPLRDYIHWESCRSGFDLRLYRDGMTHLKAMLIDDTYLIVGSSNFDKFSYCFEEETLAVISERQIIKDFKSRIIDKDHAACAKADLDRVFLKGKFCNLQIDMLARMLGLFHKTR